MTFRSFRSEFEAESDPPFRKCIVKVFAAYPFTWNVSYPCQAPPTFPINASKLRVTRCYEKRGSCFRRPILSHSRKKAGAYSYALIIRQNHEAANTPILLFVRRMQERYEAHRLVIVDGHEAPWCLIEACVQIVIVPKESPCFVSALVDWNLIFRSPSFFLLNDISSVQNTQSGSNQSNTS